MDFFGSSIWVLIPLLAILVGAFQEWLKFRAKQQQLGTSTQELERTVADLQKALETTEADRAALVRRLQNLEAIVTTQVWDALHDDALPESEKQRALAGARPLLDEPAAEPDDAEKVARLARRLGAG